MEDEIRIIEKNNHELEMHAKKMWDFTYKMGEILSEYQKELLIDIDNHKNNKSVWYMDKGNPDGIMIIIERV